MEKSYGNALNTVEEEEEEEEEEEDDYTEMEDSDYVDVDSDDSEEDPIYIDDFEQTQFKLSNLSIKTKSNLSRKNQVATEMDEKEVSNMEGMSVPKLNIKDAKDLEDIQRIIDCGQVEKLKVEQCKVYLRNHGLRLTGKKDTLIQRIKEHFEILNGGGEKKFPSSSFVLNCKGDACMGDVVMFEQTVYEGYSIVSRSAIAPPCGKRVVVGRIVKESYGAAKQQHTFTVEVLWSKGHKPLPPLHPLLIKGRNLYKLNTLRQRWEDESERQRVLSEKHSRGSVARSNREARIQGKTSKKTFKSTTSVFRNERMSSHQQKNLRSKGLKERTNLEEILEVPVASENLYAGLQQKKPNMAAANSSLAHIGPPKLQHNRRDESTLVYHRGFSDRVQQIRQQPRQQSFLEYKENYLQPWDESTLVHHRGFSDKFHQIWQHPRQQRFVEYEENYVQPVSKHTLQQKTSTYHFNQRPTSYASDNGNLLSSVSCPVVSNRAALHNSCGGNHPKEKRKPCRFYPQGKCYYGDRCKFLHEANR